MQEKSKGLLGVIVIAVVLVMGYFALSGGEEVVEEVAEEAGPITIGFMGALTGDVAFIGEIVRAGVEVAVDELNAAGGIDGKIVEVIYEDSGCDGEMGANAANKLVNVDNVLAIIGPTCTPATLAAAPIAEEAGVPMISYSATAASISEAGDYIFRTVPSDAFQAAFASDYIYNELGIETAAILSCLNDWCQGNADTFAATFEGEVLGSESFEQGSVDLRSQITKLQALEPDMIYMLSFTAGSIAGITQLNELGVMDDTLVFGADTFGDVSIWNELGELGDGIMYTEPAGIEYDEAFVEAIEVVLGGETEMNTYVPRAYDAVSVLAWAIEEAGLDQEAIKDQLYKLDGFVGMSDTYSFDENGDTENAQYDIKLIEGGKIVSAE
ncbi:ABC transporter substrate-binding protein [Candidatus Uhrbacteria bacterium]|jgi:branched-chain amino acid transport system substrate-binding protein|nr:ABC transporter substrate-binding protein [Candidatus Uhrbacteria bacterium]